MCVLNRNVVRDHRETAAIWTDGSFNVIYVVTMYGDTFI